MIIRGQSFIITRLTALAMISSMAINGFVPQRAVGSRYSFVLAVGEAGRMAVASLFICVHDPLSEIARKLASGILFDEPETNKLAASNDGEGQVPVAGSVAFCGTTPELPAPGDTALARYDLDTPVAQAVLFLSFYCRGAPPVPLSSCADRAIQISCILLLFMTSRWASSSDALRLAISKLLNPVFSECRVFLFLKNKRIPSWMPGALCGRARRLL